MSAIYDALMKIRHRPLAMYLGRVSILKFADFLRGYHHAIWDLTETDDTFLAEFRDWIQAKYNTNIAWEKVLLQQSTDEEQAVELFWKLLDQFVEFNADVLATTHNVRNGMTNGVKT